ncbi:MAG: ribose 5-phosphate isomerase B [Thermodesulfobacteriota bacterium]|nr:ribose 5-phosphate isomerase B [Thermodesulfobacteriota bacterium]
MELVIASDHAGFELKAEIIEHLNTNHAAWQVTDMGPFDDKSVDYPIYAHMVARSVAADDTTHGILICGSGLGMSMMANRFLGVRAALCTTPEMAALSRQHNRANLLCLGARILSSEENRKIVDKWMETEFSADPRHLRRIDLMDLLITR